MWLTARSGIQSVASLDCHMPDDGAVDGYPHHVPSTPPPHAVHKHRSTTPGMRLRRTEFTQENNVESYEREDTAMCRTRASYHTFRAPYVALPHHQRDPLNAMAESQTHTHTHRSIVVTASVGNGLRIRTTLFHRCHCTSKVGKGLKPSPTPNQSPSLSYLTTKKPPQKSPSRSSHTSPSPRPSHHRSNSPSHKH